MNKKIIYNISIMSLNKILYKQNKVLKKKKKTINMINQKKKLNIYINKNRMILKYQIMRVISKNKNCQKNKNKRKILLNIT